MAKFAPVAPIQVLEGLYAHSPETFGDYHLLLAHHTVEHSARFKDLFDKLEDDGWHGTIIMDNSIVELGEAVDSSMIAEAVDIVDRPSNKVYPVLPDVMGKGLETREAVAEAYPLWKDDMLGAGFCAVCQGKDFDDYYNSLQIFANKEKYPEIVMLSIPRILVKTVGSRVKAAVTAKRYQDTHEIHLLGFSDNITDDIDAALIIPDAGIDSAVPLRIREAFTEFVETQARPPQWFEEAQVDTLMIDNLQAARKAFEAR
jgi:hypothetical protein